VCLWFGADVVDTTGCLFWRERRAVSLSAVVPVREFFCGAVCEDVCEGL
jgi:hypothetical protein